MDKENFGMDYFAPSIFNDIDNIIKSLRVGELIIIGSLPSLGKTSFALFLIKELAEKQNTDSCFFSLEFPMELLKKRMSEMDINKNNDLIHIIDNPHLTIMDLKNVLKNMIDESKIKYCFIDYLNIVGGNSKQNIEETTKVLKSFALELNITIIALMQINSNLKPEINLFKSIEHDADLIISLEKNTEKTELVIIKNRNK